MKSNTALTEEYFELLTSLDGDIEGRKKAFSYMKNSTAIVHERVVACSFIPRLFNNESWETFKTISETTHAILCKVITRYLENEDYRSVFSFDKRLEELILIPRRYEAVLPFARIDVFLDEDILECGFCEFNGDGSAGMNENREITHSIEQSETFKRFSATHRIETCELFESWVNEFISIYQTFENKVETPHFAICDYLECGVVDEFYVYCDYFAQKGYSCCVCDVRNLHFDGTTLTNDKGERIDAIWRRSVTNDVLEYWDESQDLIKAVKAGAVALIGSFAGHLVHDKQIFEALRHPLTKAFLTNEENAFVERHVPQTLFLDDSEIDLNEVRNNKDAWIIKPTDNYGAKDVYSGMACTQEKWNELIDTFANGASGAPFIVQTYIKPFKTRTLPPDVSLEDKNAPVSSESSMYNNLSGLYLYNGTYQGIFSRLGPHPTISKDNEGITAATIHVCD